MSNLKPKTLFDHLKAITETKPDNYWDTLSDKERKEFKVFLINRYLSMNQDWVEIINYFQQYTVGLLHPRDVYRLYSEILPKQKVWLKYVKGKKSSKYTPALIDLFAKHFEISRNEAVEYLELYFDIAGKQAVKDIVNMYGVEPKEVTKMVKVKR